jgi:transcriptional regulator with GAF, ATPase, and Fis domain
VSPPGTTPIIAVLRDVVKRAATDIAPVCIVGDTGTGKELLAADVHRLSGRTGPYVKLNCAALSPQLIESQLFGHERGAFTGATAAHQGLFMAADKGTLFLDEVGEIPLELQAKLLRVIQEGEVRPVGSVQTRRTEARLVCATNRDLARQVEEGSFRRDLYARLSFFELRLPPVRERRQDIIRWIELLARRWGAQRSEPGEIRLQPIVAEQLLLHAWPDNLRGLDRFVHRVLSMTDGKVGLRAMSECLPELDAPASNAESSEPPPPDRNTGTDRPSGADRPSKEEFLAVYESTGRSVRATSKHFGKDRRQVYRWLEAFGIER